MKKQFKKLLQELEQNICDIRLDIMANINWEEVKCKNQKICEKLGKHNRMVRFVLLPILTVMILCVSIAMPFIFNGNANDGTNYILTLSINPSVEFTANSNDMVTSQKGLNEDGCLLLLKENLIGKPLNEAVTTVFKLSSDLGYLQTGKDIKFSYKTTKGPVSLKKQSTFESKISNFIMAYGGPSYNLVEMNEMELKELDDYYLNHNLSNFEINLVQNFQNKLIALTRRKIFDTNELITFLQPYVNDLNQIIPNFAYGIMNLMDYAIKYRFNICDYELSRLTYENISQINKKLIVERDQLFKVLDELDKGKSEDNFSLFLQDLFDLAKDSIKCEMMAA